MTDTGVSIEWFGVTTYRLRACGVAIFLDAWLDKPKTFTSHLSIEEAIKGGADYIFISHAHFDHLPGAADLAKGTGAIIIGNCEAISVCRAGGVPEEQLQRVSGGERIPLFTKAVRDAATAREVKLAPDVPNAPPRPHAELAALKVHVWPGLHALLPNAPAAQLPDVIDTAEPPEPPRDWTIAEFAGTPDITRLMEYGFMRMSELVGPEQRKENEHIDSLIEWLERVKGFEKGCLSACDGGNTMFNFIIPTASGPKALLWNAQIGYYPGIMESMEPRPDFAILSVAGQGNLSGRPVPYSTAEFIVNQIKALGEPSRVMWCLHNDNAIKPFKVITGGHAGVTARTERETNSKVVHVEPRELYQMW